MIYMKKLMICSLLSVAVISAEAQTTIGRSPLRVGIKAGGNLSMASFSADGYSDIKNKFGFGFYGGGLLELSGPAGSKWKGQLEALFNYHNFKNEYAGGIPMGTVSYKTNLAQISVPVMVKYFIIPQLSVNAGASVNFNLASKTKFTSPLTGGEVTNDNKDLDMLNTLQIGALAGATYYIYKGFFVDARYNYYFGSVFKNDNDAPTYRLSAIQLGIGYKF